MGRTLIFDTETSGLIDNSLVPEHLRPSIIEFYGCVIDDAGAIVEELDFLCDPGFKISEEIERITGITHQMLVGQLKFRSFAPDVAKIVQSCDVVVAHNLKFDMMMVETEMSRAGLSVAWPSERICTVEATEWLRGFRLSLSLLHETLFDKPFAGAHRAKVDVQALVRCFIELRNRGDV